MTEAKKSEVLPNPKCSRPAFIGNVEVQRAIEERMKTDPNFADFMQIRSAGASKEDLLYMRQGTLKTRWQMLFLRSVDAWRYEAKRNSPICLVSQVKSSRSFCPVMIST
jgi:hypothetical protein